MNKFCDYKISADKWHITINGKTYGIPDWINKNTLDDDKTMEILLRALSYTYSIPIETLIRDYKVETKFDNRIKEDKKRRKNGRET